MIRRRRNHIEFAFRLLTLTLPLLSFGVAAYIRFGSGLFRVEKVGTNYADYFALLFFATLVWAIAVDYFESAVVDSLATTQAVALKSLWACGVTYATVLGATFFYRAASFSRLFVVFAGLVMFVMSVGVQKGFRIVLHHLFQGGGNYARILIVGADEYAERTARSLLNSLVIPSEIAGFVRLPGQQATVNDFPVFELDCVAEMAVNPDVDDILVAVPPNRFPEIPVVAAKLELLCVPIRVVLDLGPGITIRDAIFQVGDLTLLDLRTSPMESIAYSIVKRSFDLLFSLLVLILTAPLMLVITILTKLASPGPLLFVQERVGLNGRLFRMYKFRTMRVGDQNEAETRWTTQNDPRRTSIGKFLRRTSLDELPQFFNVFKGDMSVVGPRPERPFFVKKFLNDVAQYNTRHFLRAGITGWAQVNGWRGDTSIARRVEYDLYYLRNWTFWFDIKIIFLTVWRGLFGNPNAY